jgi:hypothetical protein
MGMNEKESAADFRVLAATLRQMYIALREEGFTQGEAVSIVGQVLLASTGGK